MPEPRRLSLARLPTPLVRAPRLGAAFNGAQLWIKRDDLTGLEFSGNKIRKLEYVVADALSDRCDTIVTEGTPQSNHCRATAAMCARLGLRCVLLLRPAPEGPVEGNLLLDEVFGAVVRGFSRAEFSEHRMQIVGAVLNELRAAGQVPRWTPAGASEPLGCWGYIRAAAELAEQLSAEGIGEVDLVTAVSSGGTYAGLVLGVLLHKLKHVHVWGVPVSDDVEYHEREVAALCRAAIDKFHLPVEFDRRCLNFIDGYVGEGYAIPYPAALAALRQAARREALLCDPVYTAKALAALLDGLRSGRFGRERPVVFLHTGGAFSNFAWPELLWPGGGGE